MKRLKGCFNIDCVAHEKGLKFKEEYDYCPKCGQKLKYVCRGSKCYTLIEEPLREYCDECLKRQAEQKEEIKKQIVKVAKIAPEAIAVAAPIVKKGVKLITKK